MIRIDSKNLPKELLSYAQKLHKDHSQAEIYLVGGAVRDLILKRPTKDYDLVIRGLAQKTLTSWLKKYGQVNFVGKSFGVFKWQPTNWPYETLDVALPRTESSIKGTGQYRDFKITSSDTLKIEQDLARRDFTINAMAFNLQTRQLIDPHNGLADLKNKIIKCVGNPKIRFTEDLSRPLRGLRLACQLNFAIEKNTLQSIKKIAPKVCLGKINNDWLVPREIIARELLKSFYANPSKALHILFANGYLKLLLPEIINSKTTIDRLFIAWKKSFDKHKPPANVLLAALLSRTKTTRQIIKRLKLTSYVDSKAGRAEPDKIIWLIKNQSCLSTIYQAKPNKIYNLFCQDRPAGLELQQFILLYENGLPTNKKTIWLKKYSILNRQIAKLDKKFPNGKFKPLLTGQDIMKITKLRSGPKIGQLIKLLTAAELNGQVKTLNQATNLIKKYVI